MLKRYLLFAGEYYYPSGGWDDFIGDFDTLDEAKAKAGKVRDQEWAHIIEPNSGDRWEYHEACNNKTYPDWPVLPAGWFNREEMRQREEATRKAAADYRKKADAEWAAKQAAWDKKQKDMVATYRKQALKGSK